MGSERDQLSSTIEALKQWRRKRVAATTTGGSPALERFLGVRRNISLLATRQHNAEGPWAHVMATCHPAESSALDPFDIATQFPLYVYVDVPDREAAQGQLSLGLTLPGAAQ